MWAPGTSSKQRAASVTGLPEEAVARRTLRGRVSLLGLAVIAAWVLILTVAFDVVFADRLHRDLDSVLHARAAATAATVVVGPGDAVSVADQRDDQPLDSEIWVYSGRRAVDRPAAADALQPVADEIARTGGYRDGPSDTRLYGLPISHAGRQVGTVVASASTAPYERARTAAIEGSALVALLVLLGAYPVLRIAASRALRPVDEMTHRAADWSAHALTERFGTGQRFREMQVLAETLDAVLDRLSAIVRHERRLSAELSHELRTPLSAIVAETDLLRARSHPPAELDAAHQAIHESALAMERILETLLSAARVDIQDAPGRCELHLAVEHLLRSRRGDEPAVVVSVPTDLGVGVDAPIVERILAPILDNACRYARRRVTIRARRLPDSVVIEVGDDGPGVPADLQEDVFEPGRRAGGDGHDGAGLGLALARRLARAAAGDVTLASASLFAVRLPPA